MRCHCAKQPLVTGVSDTPDFHIFKTRRESNPDCQRKTSSVRRIRKVKRRRAPGVGFEPTRNAWSRISVKRPNNYTTESWDSERESKLVKAKSGGRRPTRNQVTVAQMVRHTPFSPLPCFSSRVSHNANIHQGNPPSSAMI